MTWLWHDLTASETIVGFAEHPSTRPGPCCHPKQLPGSHFSCRKALLVISSFQVYTLRSICYIDMWVYLYIYRYTGPISADPGRQQGGARQEFPTWTPPPPPPPPTTTTTTTTTERASAADPSSKSFRLNVFSHFSGSGVKKTDDKIARCFLDIILGTCWRIFAVFFWCVPRATAL